MYCFDPFTADLEVEDFVGVDAALLDEAMAAHNDEELPLGVVPVLTFGDAWFADVDAYLATVQCMYEFSE